MTLIALLLRTIEKADRGVSTMYLVQVADAQGIPHARAQVWNELTKLRQKNLIRVLRTGKGGKCHLWISTRGKD